MSDAIPSPDFTRTNILVTEALLLVMAVVWGANFAVMKYGAQMLDPLAYNGTRMALGTVALMGLVAIRRGSIPSRDDIRSLLLLGVLGNGIYQVLFIEGLARTRAGTTSLVVAASPAVIALVGRFLGVETVTPRAVVGIALSVAGIGLVILVPDGSVGQDASVIGDMLLLAGVVCWAFYTNLLRPFTQRLDGVQVAGWTLLGGAIPMLLFAAPALSRTAWHSVSPSTWVAIAYSGLMALVLAYLFWYRGVRVIGSTRTAMFSNLQPIIAMGVAWPLLGEQPTVLQGVGAAAVIGGVLLTREKSMPEPAHGE